MAEIDGVLLRIWSRVDGAENQPIRMWRGPRSEGEVVEENILACNGWPYRWLVGRQARLVMMQRE